MLATAAPDARDYPALDVDIRMPLPLNFRDYSVTQPPPCYASVSFCSSGQDAHSRDESITLAASETVWIWVCSCFLDASLCDFCNLLSLTVLAEAYRLPHYRNAREQNNVLEHEAHKEARVRRSARRTLLDCELIDTIYTASARLSLAIPLRMCFVSSTAATMCSPIDLASGVTHFTYDFPPDTEIVSISSFVLTSAH